MADTAERTDLTVPNSSRSATVARMAWWTVLLLMPVGLLNYLDRQLLASMKYSVMADIPTIGTDANWGFMLGQFKWVYAILSPIGGYVADRLSRRFTICGSLFVWSAVTWWTGHTTSYSELLWARSLMGISEAFYIPAALALITDYHTGPTRSRAVSLHQMAIYCGVIVGGFGGYVADSPLLGWRMAFGACGIFGMLYAIPLAIILRDPRPSMQSAALAATAVGPGTSKPVHDGSSKIAAIQTSFVQTIQELFANASFLLLVAYFTLPALAGWVVRDWMPAILKQQFQIGQGHAGVSATLYWQLAAIGGAMAGGWLADRWMQHNIRGRIFVSAIGMCFIIPGVLGMGLAGSLGAAIACLILFGIGWGFFDTNNMPILSQIVRPEFRATGYGVMNFVSISCGGLADWGFGVMRDKAVPLPIIFGVFASAAAVSGLLVLLIRPRKELAA